MPIINRPILYAQQMSSVDNGLALWDPQPGWVQDSNGKLTRPCPHIRPGDVGYVEEDGGFIRLFNIHLPEDHSDQGMGPFPEHFEPVQQDMGRLQSKTVAPIVYHSQRRLNVFGSLKTVAPLPVSGSTHLSFERNTGALLGFFDSGLREDSRMNRTYMEQTVNSGSSWLRAAQSQDPSRCLEDIILVTGCTRVRSWVTGVIENERIDGKLMLSVGFTSDASVGLQISSGISYENAGSSSLKYGPAERLKHHDISSTPSKGKDKAQDDKRHHIEPSDSQSSSTEESLSNAIKDWSDQCIFIRGFRMKQQRFGGNMIPKKLKAAAEPRDPRKDKEPDQDILLVGPLDEDEDEGDEMEKAGDHMKAALDYILENSDADFALIHEDDILEAYRLSTTKGECFNIGQVLQSCHPEVFVKDYNGVKVGSMSEHNNVLQKQSQRPTLAAEKQEYFAKKHTESPMSSIVEPSSTVEPRHMRRSGLPSRGFDNRGSRTMTVSAAEAAMIQLLRHNQIGLAGLEEMIYGQNRSEGEVNFNAPAVMALAHDFHISGGNFTAANQQHVVSTTTYARHGSYSVEGRNEGRLEAPMPTQRDVMGRANNFTNPEHRSYSNPSRGGSHAYNPSTPAQSTYQSRTPSNSSLSPGASARFSAHRMDSSSGGVRHGTTRQMNVLGPSVMAGASNFEFGEDAILEHGALTAAGSQTIYQQEVDSDYPN